MSHHAFHIMHPRHPASQAAEWLGSAGLIKHLLTSCAQPAFAATAPQYVTVWTTAVGVKLWLASTTAFHWTSQLCQSVH